MDSRGFAFVRYYSDRDAEDAIRGMDGRKIDGREIRVQRAMYGRPSSRKRGRYISLFFAQIYVFVSVTQVLRFCRRSPSPRRRRSRSYSSRRRSRDRYDDDYKRDKYRDSRSRSRDR